MIHTKLATPAGDTSNATDRRSENAEGAEDAEFGRGISLSLRPPRPLRFTLPGRWMEVSLARGPGTVMNLGRLFRGPLGGREFLRVAYFCEAHVGHAFCRQILWHRREPSSPVRRASLCRMPDTLAGAAGSLRLSPFSPKKDALSRSERQLYSEERKATVRSLPYPPHLAEPGHHIRRTGHHAEPAEVPETGPEGGLGMAS